VIAVWRQRDVGRFAALQPGPLRYRDHRRLFQLDLDREGFLDFTRPLLTMRSASAALELLATRGERLALMRFTLEMEDEVVGPSAIDSLLLIETDARGTIVAYDRYEITDAWNSRDRPRLRACYSDDIVVEDHRHAGLGRIEVAEAYFDSNVLLWELAPDQRLEIGWSWPAVDRHGFVVTIRREGTVPDGGPFESEYLLLGLARNGRVIRSEFFELDALDKALARLAECGA
jgi:ketosteroid isomerase-like protein